MRVIAGTYKSRQLKSPKVETTRPTTDRNKESMFNMIGPYFDGGTVLDLFAGSGGLGIEAISRGCTKLYSIDSNYHAFLVMKENVKMLQIPEAVVWKLDYKKALYKLKEENVKFDLVLLDPPYGKQLVDDILVYLVENEMLQEEATVVVEELIAVEFIQIPKLTLQKKKEHGITAVSVFLYQSEV